MTLFFAPQTKYSISMTKLLFTLARQMYGKINNEKEEVSYGYCSIKDSSVRLSESIVILNDKEAAFVDLETKRLLRYQKTEAQRKRKLGIPPPPTPGKIAYAVYMF